MMYLFHMNIISEEANYFLLNISLDRNSTLIKFNPENKTLLFCDRKTPSEILKRNEYQFRKVLHIKRPETYYPGFELNFTLKDGKDVAAFNDLSKIIVLDRTNGKHTISKRDKERKGIKEIYIDGSYLQKINKGGFAVIIKLPNGDYELNTFKTSEKSSSLIELEAAIKGLELLKNEKEIRICTDSQYVRKGLTEWIINWKLNNWKTANGEKVKNIKHWKKFDILSKDKYLEFKYVKAHSQQFENTMADLYARDMAKK